MSGQICPECLARHPAGTGRCPSDRAGLLDLGEGPEPLGTVFADRFLILDRIGKGGMAVVYRAWQRNVRRLVAVKVLPADDPGDRKRIQRFVREGWLTAPLQCPHTVRVHDSGCLPDGTLFLAMELLTGRTLEQILKDEGRLEARRACGLVCQVCLALEEAHGKGIVHRDLKPTNLMVERLGDQGDFARVLDFGIAAVLDERVTRLTRSGEVFGTPYYMSPEQFESRPVGPWTDLYALGIVLYECIVGDPPLVADSQFALMVKHCKTPPPHLGEDLGLGPLREPLDRIVQRCLAKKPEDRPPSAAALRRDLEALLRQEPAHSGPEPQPVSVQRSRRPVGRLAAIAVPAVCLLGLAAGLVVSSDRLFDTPAEVAEDTGTEAMGVVAPWPDRIRFLVMPLSAFPEREADRSLWPLVDRMIVNALEPDELLLDRLERVDPARVESEIRRREMAVPPGDDDIRELAKTMNANVVLQGRIFRAGGEVRIEGTIRTLAAREGLPVQAAGTNVVEAAENLVPAIRSVLWGQAPAQIPG